MEIDSQTGLVLEGGGMRAIFTVGVLDYFMDHDIWFPYTIGVCLLYTSDAADA